MPPLTTRQHSPFQNLPETQISEHSDLFYDDGVAEPEYYFDNKWTQSNGEAAAQLFTALTVSLGGVFTLAYVLTLISPRPIAPWQEHCIPDLRVDYGLSKEVSSIKGKEGLIPQGSVASGVDAKYEGH